MAARAYTKDEWEKGGKFGYATYKDYLAVYNAGTEPAGAGQATPAPTSSTATNYYDTGNGQGQQKNTQTTSSYEQAAKAEAPGAITIKGFGGGYAGGAGGRPATLYGDRTVTSSSEIKNLWATLRNQKDPRVEQFINEYAGGNAKVAKAIWDDAATYASNLAKAGQAVDFFDDVLKNDVFKNEVLSIPKSLAGGTGKSKGPIPYSTEYNELSARKMINDVWNAVLGRDAGPQEISNLVKKLNLESKNNPNITINGKTVQGFNDAAAKAFLEDQAKKSSSFGAARADKFSTWLSKALPGVNISAIQSDPGFANVQALYNAGNESGAARALKSLSTVTSIGEKAKASADASVNQVLMSYAKSMGLSDLLQPAWFDEAVNAINDGLATTDYYKGEIKNLAKSAYPGLVQAIDSGQSVETAASPYVYAMSKILEIPSEQLNINDNMIKSALNARDKDGKIVQKSLWEFEQDLRNDPRWGYTKNAREQLDSVAHSVLRDFGLMY